jgi:hypothetical protein
MEKIQFFNLKRAKIVGNRVVRFFSKKGEFCALHGSKKE